jgi:hypothetical protein
MTFTRTIKPWKAESQRVLSTEEAMDLIKSQPGPVPVPTPTPIPTSTPISPQIRSSLEELIMDHLGSTFEELLKKRYDSKYMGQNMDKPVIDKPLSDYDILTEPDEYIPMPDPDRKTIGRLYGDSI